jgi:carbonic anhydrase
MQKLVKGVFEFQEKVHRPMRDFFEKLAYGQQPRALFITCCDSRVNPDLMTQAEPGELFMIRNAGNLVPSYGAVAGGEAATIEYAVAKLGVRNIIVCGHSHCGAMNALMNPDSLHDLPALSEWLHHASSSHRIALTATQGMSAEEAWETVAKINVLMQIENLRTHPVVAEGLTRGDLYLHGWYYCFATGDVQTYHPDERKFISMSERAPVAVVPPEFQVDKIPSRPGTDWGAKIAEGSQPHYHESDDSKNTRHHSNSSRSPRRTPRAKIKQS